jgi:hypothetical protein
MGTVLNFAKAGQLRLLAFLAAAAMDMVWNEKCKLSGAETGVNKGSI